MSLSRLLHRPALAEKVIIGEFRGDLEADKIAEKRISSKFSEVMVISSVEGRKLIPIQEIIKIERKLYEEKEEEHKNGYAKGYQQGKAEGYAEAKKVIANFASLINDAIGQREILYNEARKQILDLVIKISKRVTCDAARLDPNITAEIISGAVNKLVNRSKLKVKVHPNHLPIIEQQIERFKGDSAAIKEIIIEADSRVHYGGCFIETPSGDIDARVESQLEIIGEALRDVEGNQ
jgi:flagellar biosynthesis/type III secretory pathway protein FliH